MKKILVFVMMVGLTKTYAQQNSDALKKNMMLLHVNWFKSAESDPEQLALIRRTQSEIERAKADFPELKIASIESQWSEEQRSGGVIGPGDMRLPLFYAFDNLLNRKCVEQ